MLRRSRRHGRPSCRSSRRRSTHRDRRRAGRRPLRRRAWPGRSRSRRRPAAGGPAFALATRSRPGAPARRPGRTSRTASKPVPQLAPTAATPSSASAAAASSGRSPKSVRPRSNVRVATIGSPGAPSAAPSTAARASARSAIVSTHRRSAPAAARAAACAAKASPGCRRLELPVRGEKRAARPDVAGHEDTGGNRPPGDRDRCRADRRGRAGRRTVGKAHRAGAERGGQDDPGAGRDMGGVDGADGSRSRRGQQPGLGRHPRRQPAGDQGAPHGAVGRQRAATEVKEVHEARAVGVHGRDRAPSGRRTSRAGRARASPAVQAPPVPYPAAIGSTSQKEARSVAHRARSVAARPLPSAAWAAIRARSSASRPVAGAARRRRAARSRVACPERAQRRGPHARGVDPQGHPTVRVVQVGPAAGHAGAEVRADRAQDHDDARRSCTRSRAGPMPSTTASAPVLRTAKRIPARPTRWSRPPVAPYRQVLPAIASRSAPSRRRGPAPADDDASPPDRPLADVVVGLADRAAASTPGPANAPKRWPAAPRRSSSADRAAAARRARARPVSAGRRTSGRRSSRREARPAATAPPGRASAADEAGLERRRGLARRRRGRRAPGSARRAGRRRAHGRRADDRRRGRAPRPRRDGAEPVGSRPTTSPTDRAPTAASSRRTSSARAVKKPHDLLGRAGELGPEVLALGGDARSGRCRGGTGGPCRSRSRRAPPSRTRTPRRRAARRRAGRGRSAGRRPCAARRGRAGRCGAATWWTSARPSSHGAPTCLIDESGDWRRSRRRGRTGGRSRRRPWPRRPRSSRRRASATSLTPIRAAGLIARRSAMSWARSSIE